MRRIIKIFLSTSTSSFGLLIAAMCMAYLLVFSFAAAAEPSYQKPPTLRASYLLPANMISGPLFHVDDEVPTDGLMGHYTLRSEYGTFVVPGRELLRIRIAELPAIQQLNKVSNSQEFLDAMGQAAEKPIQSAENLISNPEKTLSGIPSGISRLFDSVEQGAKAITRAASTPGESTTQKMEATLDRIGSVTMTALGYEQTRRQLAQSLGVDPYTTNPVLAKKLSDVARVAFSGNLAVNSLVTAFVPASIAITGTNFTSDLVYDTSAADLIQMDKQKMLNMGASEDQVQALLNNRWYSLSVLTSLVGELERLPGVSGAPEVIVLAATARNEEEARFLASSVQMLAWLNASGTPISQIAGRGTVVGIGPNGDIVVPAPVDYISWTERIGNFAKRTDLEAGQRSIWLSGKMSGVAQRGFTELHWTLYQGPWQ
ncbi:MAG: hypothetical protein WCA08_18845 [Desulfoferrobacter sp.]